MNKIIFIAITGTQGSGKTVFCETAKEQYKIPSFRLGEIVIAECQNRELPVTGRNMAKMATVLRHEEGPQAIAARAIPELKKMLTEQPKEKASIIIDGIRSYAELACLEKEFGKILLIAVLATVETRKERVIARKRLDQETIGDFEEREERELAFGIGDVQTKADYIILNEGKTLVEFKNEILSLLEKITPIK